MRAVNASLLVEYTGFSPDIATERGGEKKIVRMRVYIVSIC